MNELITVVGMASGEGGSGGAGMHFMTMMIIIFAIMYFLIIRPQKKKEQERQRMLDEVKKNDRVVTIGGMHGQVMSVRGDEVIIRIDQSKDVRVKFNKSAVSRIISSAEGEPESEAQ